MVYIRGRWLTMKRITAYTWGYWGWGTHAADFVRNLDAVEKAHGWKSPLFVDIRIRRTGRAPDFQQNAFERLVGQRRYRWMKTLGNRSIITKVPHGSWGRWLTNNFELKKSQAWRYMRLGRKRALANFPAPEQLSQCLASNHVEMPTAAGTEEGAQR